MCFLIFVFVEKTISTLLFFIYNINNRKPGKDTHPSAMLVDNLTSFTIITAMNPDYSEYKDEENERCRSRIGAAARMSGLFDDDDNDDEDGFPGTL